MTFRYGAFVRDYIDLGVYRSGRRYEPLEMSQEDLWFPSKAVNKCMMLEPRIPQTRLGYLVEARLPNEDTSTGEKEEGRKERLGDPEKLVGRAFSKVLKIAQIRAQEKLFERIIPLYPWSLLTVP